VTRVSTGSRSLAGRREAPSPAGPAHLAPWLTAATLAIAALPGAQVEIAARPSVRAPNLG